MFTSHICECKSCLKIHRATRFFYVWNTLFSTKKSFQLLKKIQHCLEEICTSCQSPDNVKYSKRPVDYTSGY